jgi:hypothetical protein
MPIIEFINKLVELLQEVGIKAEHGDYTVWTAGDYCYMEGPHFTHLMWQDICIYSE